MAIVASVNVRRGHTGSTGSRTWCGNAPSCQTMAVDITSFIVRWMGPTAKGACRGGGGIFGELCRILVPTTFNTGKRAGKIGFSMPLRLASGTLYDRIFLRGASTVIFMLHKNWRS